MDIGQPSVFSQDNLLYLDNFLITSSNAINIKILNLFSSRNMLFSSTTVFFAKVSTAGLNVEFAELDGKVAKIVLLTFAYRYLF
jgi:hypothetical protein